MLVEPDPEEHRKSARNHTPQILSENRSHLPRLISDHLCRGRPSVSANPEGDTRVSLEIPPPWVAATGKTDKDVTSFNEPQGNVIDAASAASRDLHEKRASPVGMEAPP